MELVKHETCQQYVARRLSEGWSIVWQKGFHLILASPDGNILRPVDLRNDIETLRPNAAGSATGIPGQFPDSTFHWDKVDEASPDEDDTYVYFTGLAFQSLYDVYNIPNHAVGSGTINFIKVYVRCRYSDAAGQARAMIKPAGSTGYICPANNLTDSYVTYNYQWDTNPYSAAAWTWDDIDALEIGVHLAFAATPGTARCTQVYIEVDYTPAVAPTVTAQAASSVEATAATSNGNITDNGGEDCDKRGVVYDTSAHADPGNVAPGASGYASYAEDTDGFGEGAFTKAISGLPTGTTIYYRMYAHNSAGYDYSNTEITFLTKPAAPTNVAATDGDHTDKVVITWTKSTGATGYKVYEGVNLLDTLGDVATYDDVAAPAPTITPGTAAASDGTSSVHVVLSLAEESANVGASRTYKVVAFNATGDSVDSDTDTGYRGVGALTYQWQRSAADSDAAYANIAGATTDPYNDTGAPGNGQGRWYLCLLDATGAVQAESTHDRGYRWMGEKTAHMGAKMITEGLI